MFASIPSFGLGTFRLQGQTVIDSVATGLDVGYRHIDTAQIYGNEAEVGQALFLGIRQRQQGLGHRHSITW